MSLRKHNFKNHQIQVLFLALSLSFSLITGCSNSSNSVNSTISTSDGQPSNQAENIIDKEVSAEPDISTDMTTSAPTAESEKNNYSLADIPAYSGSPYVALNGNVPYFSDEELNTTSFETYSPLDSLGRCGVAYANVGQDLMPTEERGSIGQVKPSGWHTVKYDIIEGKYLYNRCHLIGYQLTAENANTQNLITGTRYLNVQGMLPFENLTADYIKETGNHVLYRVTPVFDGNNLVASGVIMEAKSVEDNGDGVLFCVYCYNVQPKITIDYATGDSTLDENSPDTTVAANQDKDSSVAAETVTQTPVTSTPAAETYVLNTNTHKFHKPSCSSIDAIKDENREDFTGSREDLIARGYEACKKCNP